MTLQEVADRLELRALVDAYAVALDRRDVTRLVSLFTPDAHFGIYEPGAASPSHRFDGPTELARLMLILDDYGETMHLMANQTVELAGDAADGEVYCQAYHLTERDGEMCNLAMTIRYQDRYSRTPDGWRIARREVIRLWNELRPVLTERTVF